MVVWVTGILLALALLLLAAGWNAARRLRDPADPLTGILYLVGRAYARLFHHLRVETEPGALSDIDGPLLVVSNHTAGVDPLLISAACPRRIGWMMAEDMRIRRLNWFWRWQGVIFVTRDKEGRKGLRDARAALAGGACIGIFPEGRLERPHGRLLPFNPGVGMLVKRTGARILPVVIDGTPETESAWHALWTPSHARVRFMRPISYADSTLTPAEIAADLQHRYTAWTGWPVATHAPAARLNHEPRPPTDAAPNRSIA
jgi:1-acyl-sn-glycerol-3-phosphate acyltransferase